MKITSKDGFFRACPNESYYVGFLGSAGKWSPLTFPGIQEACKEGGYLLLSTSYQNMQKLLREHAGKGPHTVQTSVQLLSRDEIQNILHQYSLGYVGLALPVEGARGCGHGCGCTAEIPREKREERNVSQILLTHTGNEEWSVNDEP